MNFIFQQPCFCHSPDTGGTGERRILMAAAINRKSGPQLMGQVVYIADQTILAAIQQQSDTLLVIKPFASCNIRADDHKEIALYGDGSIFIQLDIFCVSSIIDRKSVV